MRVSFVSDENLAFAAIVDGFRPVAEPFGMDARFYDAGERQDADHGIALGHCLNDLLYRWRIGALPIDIVGVVSIHFEYQKVGVNHDIPFHHINVTKENKPKAEAALMKVIESTKTELVVFARYMQVLSDDMCRTLSGQLINIHHFFCRASRAPIPKSRPRARREADRCDGAHVTADLDEGLIIEQDTVRMTHAQSAEDYVSLGQDVESQVLARAIHAHIHHRGFINGNRTVIFSPSPGSYASERMGWSAELDRN